ncbi:MAG: hypothetical protein WC647_18545 [Desulfomonilaceae bacterium]|jgi:hypothetical protein
MRYLAEFNLCLVKINGPPTTMKSTIPVILFAYARPDHLLRTIDCLRQNNVPLIYAFSDGPRTPRDAPAAAEVRRILRSIDWCKLKLCERETNLGLGRSILTGVTEVLNKHNAALVYEDDLVCVPGTYTYLCEALKRYRDDDRVMSVTGWTHPIITPSDIKDQPYFDGRAECWVWGTWTRAWQGMATDAKSLMKRCERNGIDIYRYGADLVDMANIEVRRNIWAVRLLYWHILNNGLCLRPPWSMVQHIGWDSRGTNALDPGILAAPPLRACPPIPSQWPTPAENSECALLHQKAYGGRPDIPTAIYRFSRRMAAEVVRFISLR